MKILNITNGDGAANILKESTISGDVLPWRDPMHHGPFPAGLTLSELSTLRARYLAGSKGDPSEAERDFRIRDQHLEASQSYDKVILWFEHDLLDQLQILQILAWYAQATLDDVALEMICIDRFPGKPDFRGVGQLNPQEMASLFDQRQSVTAEMLGLAVAGWVAFRSSDPSDLLTFLNSDLNALPFLADALQRHLEEFPDAATGLTRTEAQVLRLIGEGVQNPQQVFLKNMDLEKALFVGDWPTYATIETLCVAGLVNCDPPPFRFPSYSNIQQSGFADQRLSLTETGRRVLDDKLDVFNLIARDGWLGGVELCIDGKLWTWDPKSTRFLRRAV